MIRKETSVERMSDSCKAGKKEDGNTIKGKNNAITVYCSCGQRLFDMDKRTKGIVSIKCCKCRRVLAVTMKNQKYDCLS